MITGAKRYILAPPKQCKNLGIVNKRQHPIFRHSMLNFGHVDLLEDKSKESILEVCIFKFFTLQRNICHQIIN